MTQMRVPTYVFLLVTVFLDTVGGSLTMPVLPYLLKIMEPDGVAAHSLLFGTVLSTEALSAFLLSPVLGRLSDAHGRRPVIITVLAIAVLNNVICAMTSSFVVFLAARFINGACAAGVAVTGAYFADASPPEKRAQVFGMVGAIASVAALIGFPLGGFLGQSNPRVVFWMAAAVNCVSFLYGLLVLPESLAREKRRAFSFKEAHPFAFWSQVRRVRALRPILIVYCLTWLANSAAQPITPLFTQLKFGWTSAQLGLLVVVLLVGNILGGAVITRLAVRQFGDRGAVYIGLIVTALVQILFAMAGASWQMYAIAALCAVSSIAAPAFRAIATRTVPENEQGAWQGTTNSLAAIVQAAGPLVGTAVFSFFNGALAPVQVPGAGYLFCAAVTVITLLTTWGVLRTGALGRKSAPLHVTETTSASGEAAAVARVGLSATQTESA